MLRLFWVCLAITLVDFISQVHSRPQSYQDQENSNPANIQYRKETKVTILPFYGGGKGQSLQIIETPDGKQMTSIIKTPEHLPAEEEEEEIDPIDLENPSLPSRYDTDFNSDIKRVHKTASNIIKLQELSKSQGKLSSKEEEIYQQNIDELNQSASNLAARFEEPEELAFENREGLAPWFERKQAMQKEKNKKKDEKNKNNKDKHTNKEENEEQNKKPNEQNKNEEEIVEENNKGDVEDAILINLPPEDASVAEAKPVGLAIAGEGGVAASKPVATAVVGPAGLAIARPVGTAIAGVSPEQALVPIYAEGYVGSNKPSRNGSNKKPESPSDYLNRLISKYHQH